MIGKGLLAAALSCAASASVIFFHKPRSSLSSMWNLASTLEVTADASLRSARVVCVSFFIKPMSSRSISTCLHVIHNWFTTDLCILGLCCGFILSPKLGDDDCLCLQTCHNAVTMAGPVHKRPKHDDSSEETAQRCSMNAERLLQCLSSTTSTVP